MCNCQQNEVEIELWLEFWRPWIAKTLARAKVFDEIVDSYTDFGQKPVVGGKALVNERKPTETIGNQRKRSETNLLGGKMGLSREG